MNLNNTECERPNCTRVPEKTYSDENGNRLQLCQTCYYRLVTADTHTVPINNTNFDNRFIG